ncbi:MAG TPA: NAD-dependent epimerase/dehydratase family protein [Steroidobacteraceae bacterium]|jgi:2'-hydroxyisoflavone reductase|nr:NAD-dependent epimerase/dehydratase family protein [Steroidobacteraceae bacterium]
MLDRREFMAAATLAAAGAAASSWSAEKARQPLRILLLGGTRFIGVPITELALKRGHTVTFFNRGKTNTDVLPQIERITGDRNGQLDGLKDRKWDAVIDTSAYVPRVVKLSTELLAPNVGQYLLVSSISVYPSFSQPRTEESPVGTLKDETVETVDNETYGPLKALCEKAAEAAMPGRVTVLRPGLIVGPHDSTDRFTYWPARAARGGDMLAPGTPRDRIQIIDARDLAAFALDTLERRITGTFNLVSPPGLFTMGDVVNESIRAAKALAKPNPPPRAVWASAAFLEKQKVEGWSDMPVWLAASGDDAAFAQTSSARAIKAGLKITPMRKTVYDTLEWHLARPEAERTKLKAGIDPDREQKVLAAWRSESGTKPA